MKKIAILSALLAMAGLAHANMLTNGDFEDATSAGWSAWWGGNSSRYAPDPIEGDNCGGVWWMDDGLHQTVAIGPGVYEISGSIMHENLGNSRIGLIKPEMKDADGNILWAQEYAIAQTDPAGTWLHGSLIIDNTAGAATQLTVNLFMYDQNGWGSGVGIVRYDDIVLMPYGTFKALFPNPADGATVPLGTDVLSWTNPDPNNPADVVTSDVYFGADDPNNVVLIADDITDEFVTLSALIPPVTLADNTQYYWRVDCTDPHGDPNTGGPRVGVGDFWTFDTGDSAPVADAGPDQYVWLTDGTVTFTLSGAYADDGDSPVTTEWVVAGQDPAEATILIANPAALETQVTIDSTGWYQFQLNVDDAVWHDDDMLNVGVYGSACEAAMEDPADAPLAGDLDGDCDTDLEDFAILASSWLECMSPKLGCM